HRPAPGPAISVAEPLAALRPHPAQPSGGGQAGRLGLTNAREARLRPPAKCGSQAHLNPAAAQDDPGREPGEQRRAGPGAYVASVEVSKEAALEIWSSSKSLTSAGNYPTVDKRTQREGFTFRGRRCCYLRRRPHPSIPILSARTPRSAPTAPRRS